MKKVHDWYTFGWQLGSSNAKASQSSSHLNNATSWYEFGWRAGMNADLSIPQQPSGLGSKFRNWWQSLAQSFSLQFSESFEPQIWKADQSEGLFNVRDPRTGRVLHSATEQEVRVWLEERYNA